MQRLSSEWGKWERFSDEEKSAMTMLELARAFIRQKQSAEAVQCFVPAAIQAKIDKWETRIRDSRESGKPIIADELESLLAGDINSLFPEQEQEQELEGDEITNIETIFGGQGEI